MHTVLPFAVNATVWKAEPALNAAAIRNSVPLLPPTNAPAENGNDMKKMISAVAAIILLLSLTGCHKLEATDNGSYSSLVNTQSETTGVSLTETESESQTEPSEVTEETTTEESTTESTTESTVISTTKKVITTAITQATKIIYEGVTRSVKASSETELKYSVIRKQSFDKVYAVNADGTETYLGKDNIITVYDRFFYLADYDDLLPAAKRNRQTYADKIDSVLSLTNQMRAKKGLKALKLSSKLTEQACVRAEEVAWSGRYSHIRPGAKSFRSIFEENGYETGTVGENLGWNYNTPSQVCTAWRNSESHYENIMNPDFEYIGIGVAANCDETCGLVWVQHFYCE